MSLNLKHIPCPAGSKCTAFLCVFGHESDKASPTPSVPTEGTSDELQPPPPKRAKLEPNGRPETSMPASKPHQEPAQNSRASPPQRTNGATLHSATRPVSPPPRKRPRSVAASPSSPQSALQPLSSSVASSPTVTSSTRTSGPGKSAPRGKVESLNPRLIQSAPASHEVRLKLLKMLHEQYSRLNQELKKKSNDGDAKLLLSEQQLTVRALDEEQKVAMEKGPVYANILKNTIMKFKRMNVDKWKAEREQECAAETEKPKKNDDGSAPKEIKTGLNSLQEVKLLKRILTPITDLAQHGYVPAVPSEEAINSAREGKAAAQGWEKCDRCQQRFQVFPGRREEDGALTSGGTCKFHWGKTYIPHKAPGDMSRLPRRYKCCGEDVGESSGCFTCDYHVYKTIDAKTLATIVNFAETPPNPTVPKDRAVSFDCEMGYTVHGLELIRLTAVSWPAGEELLDVLVRPVGEILDLNSRYSGVWPEDMARAKAWAHGDPLKPAKSSNESGSEDGELRSSKQDLRVVSSPEVARELLFSLISPATPLIGHGLENDLNSVRIVHPTVVDTVLLYPHKVGLPYRHGLKMLMDVHLNRKIQQETGPKMLGHDSAEDARAAGELVRLKIMELWESMQREGWKVVNGDFVSPA